MSSPINHPKQKLTKHLSILIAVALLAANGLAWTQEFSSRKPTYTVEPKLPQDMVDLRNQLVEGDHSGESFEVHITEEEAAETVAWFLERYPEIPFRNPRFAIHPGEVEAWGEAHVLGLRLSLHGLASITLDGETPVIMIEDLGVAGAPVPRFVVQAVQDTVYSQLDLTNKNLPVRIETLELNDGEAMANGTIR